MPTVTAAEVTVPADLRVQVVPARETVFVVLHGELDLATAPTVEEELAGLREVGFSQLVLDLRALDFMDSTGLSLIVRQLDAGQFAIVPGDGQPCRLLEMTGLLDAVPHVRPRDAPLL